MAGAGLCGLPAVGQCDQALLPVGREAQGDIASIRSLPWVHKLRAWLDNMQDDDSKHLTAHAGALVQSAMDCDNMPHRHAQERATAETSAERKKREKLERKQERKQGRTVYR